MITVFLFPGNMRHRGAVFFVADVENCSVHRVPLKTTVTINKRPPPHLQLQAAIA
jgi:hypothetical protein